MRAKGPQDPIGQERINAKGTHNLLLVGWPRTDLSGTLGENLSKGLVKPVQEFAKSITKTSSKMREPKTYNEAINNAVHENRWQEAINEEL